MDDWDWEEAEEFDALVTAAKSEPRRLGYARSVEREPMTERLTHLVELLYYSRYTALLHGFTFFMASMLLLTTLGFWSPLSAHPWTLLGLEVAVTGSLVLEVSLKGAVIGRSHMKSWTGSLDLLIATASVVFLCLEAPWAKFRSQQREDLELSQSLIMVRILVQFARLLLLAEHAQRARSRKAPLQSLEDLTLDFTALREWELRLQQMEDEDFV